MVKDWNDLSEASREKIIATERMLIENDVSIDDALDFNRIEFNENFGKNIKSNKSLDGAKRIIIQIRDYRAPEATNEIAKRDGLSEYEKTEIINDLFDLEDDYEYEEYEYDDFEEEFEAIEEAIETGVQPDISIGPTRQTDYQRLRQWAIDNDYPDEVWEMEADDLFDFLRQEGEFL